MVTTRMEGPVMEGRERRRESEGGGMSEGVSEGVQQTATRYLCKVCTEYVVV